MPKAKLGRRPLDPEAGKMKYRVTVNLPTDIWRWLKGKAKEHGQGINAETREVLAKSHDNRFDKPNSLK